jgi:hypothetical protein
MLRGLTARAALLSAATLALIWFTGGAAAGQTATATPTAAATGTQDCADFDTQEEAQAFYDQHVQDTPGNPDPFDLDTDGDGKACEGLPTSASASPGATAAPTATATPAATNGTLPQNGAETGVIALSGLSLLELGYGLTLASRRLGVRRRAIPLYLLRKFASAARKGDGHVQVAEDMYLVHRSVLESGASTKTLAPVSEEIDDAVETSTDDVALFDIERDGSPMVTAGEYPNVYAALARPGAVRRD